MCRVGAFLVLLLALALAQPLQPPQPVELRAAQALLSQIGAGQTPCPDYSRAYRAARINADPMWQCGFLPQRPPPERLARTLLEALKRVYPGYSRVFSPLAFNPDCACSRMGVYFRHRGRLVAWSLSFASDYTGQGTLIWLKYQVLS